MRTLGLAFLLFITLFITSCQVKEKTSDGGLVSDHTPTGNKFSLQTPTAKVYVEGETITFKVSFPFDIIADTTGGDPRLRLTVGSVAPTTRYADFVTDSDPRVLTFTYEVAASENDTNGVDVNALELDGSILQFDNNGTLTNCNVATVTTKNFSNVKIDTAGATISEFKLATLPGWFNAGEVLTFTFKFNESVFVTGTPKFTMDLTTGGTVDVEYASGSGTNILTFFYTVTDSDEETDGVNNISDDLDIGAGSIKDAVGNDANLSFSTLNSAVEAYSTAVEIVGLYPFVKTIDVPANGTYLAGQTLNFEITFDRDVTISGNPYLGITIGSVVREAQYASGSGSDTLIFTYTAVPGDVDADGITVPTRITQRAASNIVSEAAPTESFFADAQNTLMAIPNTSGIIINAIQPMAVTAARNVDITPAIWGTPTVDNKWNIGQVLNVTIGFNTPVVVDQTLGTPSIGLIFGSTTVQAPYVSGTGQSSLIFRYTIQEGDLDTDGTVSLGTISLNGGNITDVPGTNILLTLPASGVTSTTIDGVRPVLNSLTPPANRTYSTNVNMNFTANWSEAVHYMATGSIAMVAGVLATPLNSINNDSATITHRPNLASRNDNDGVVVSSPLTAVGGGAIVVKDQAGNEANAFTFTSPATTGILVDTVIPTVASVVPITADGTYRVGEKLEFTVTFSESVTTNVVTSPAVRPCITVVIGSTNRCLRPSASTTNTVHTFEYTLVAADNDNNGIAVANRIQSDTTSGYVRDAGENIVDTITTFTSPNTTGIKVDNTAPNTPTATSFSGTHESGETLSFVLTYSEPMFVTGGTPYIRVAAASGNLDFPLVSGDGTTTLTFSYTLTGDDYDFDGLATSINTITLNSATILDAGRNPATGTNTFQAQNLSGVRLVFPNTSLWVKKDFVSLAKAGSPTVSNAGTASYTTCNAANDCRLFNGDDALNLGGALNNVETVFIVVKNPATLGSHDIFKNAITLTPGATTFDFTTFLGRLWLNNADRGTNTFFNVNRATNSVNIIQIDFDTAQDFTAGALIGTTFDGGIGEVMAITGTLTTTQKSIIRSYLDSTY